MSVQAPRVDGMSLDGSTSLVTGGASGLGRAITLALAAEGSRVVVLDPDAAAADETVGLVEAAGGSAVASIGDVRDDDHVATAFALAGERLTYVVNNAGGWGPARHQFPEVAPADWRAALELNMIAPMRLVQRALDALPEHGGIVNIASDAGIGRAAYGSPEYAVAKAGIIRLTTSLPREPVRVNTVVPGWIGLERAHAELAALPVHEREALPPLIPVDTVTDQVCRLLVDTTLSGRVVVLRGGEPPQDEDA